jgi:outer membrane receptor protein involved in Fe transport
MTWAFHGFGASIFERFFDSYKECGDSTGLSGSDGACYQLAQNASTLGVPQSTLIHEVPAYTITNINISYALKSSLGNTRFQFGINNLFDISPPVVLDSENTFATDPSAYDTVGRYFYVMLTQKFL